jgi:hypothetical protein
MGGGLYFGMVGGMCENRCCIFTVLDDGLCQANLCKVMHGFNEYHALWGGEICRQLQLVRLTPWRRYFVQSIHS